MLQLGPPPVEAACRCGHLHHAAAAALHAEAPEHSDDESVDLPESPTCSKAELRTPRELLSLQAEGPETRATTAALKLLDRLDSLVSMAEADLHTLCQEVGRLGLANIAQVLVASLRATSEPAAPPPCVHIAAALDRLLARARLCLVRLVSPLQAFLEEEQRRDAWCALPLEAVEALLQNEELGVDVEESVLEAVLLWLDRNLASAAGEEAQRAVATRLLGHVRVGQLLPYALGSAWERSGGMRLFDPERRLVKAAAAAAAAAELAAAEGVGDAMEAEGACGVGSQHQSACGKRPCATGVRKLVHTFQLWPAGPFRAQSFDDVCFHGLLWAAAMAPSTPDGRVLKLVLRCSYPPATQQPVPMPQPDGGGSGGEGGEEAPQHAQQEAGCEGDAAAHPQPGAAAAGRLAGPSITAQFCVHRQTPCVLHGRLHRRSTRQPCTSHACLMSWHPGRGRVEGYFSASLDLSNMLDVTGEKLTWATLFGPNCPYVHEGAIHVTAKLAVVP